MDDLHTLARQTTADTPLRLAVASAGEAHIIEAVRDATEAGYVTPVLFGDETVISELCEKHKLSLDTVSIQTHGLEARGGQTSRPSRFAGASATC